LLAACGLLDPVLGRGYAGQPVADLIGYGGAAYGGKSDGDLGVAIAAAFAYPGCKIAFFRRTYPELTGVGGAIPRSHELLAGTCSWKGEDRSWQFPTGSVLQFFHCQAENDVYRLKSLQFDILIVDEATSFTWFIIDYILTRNRATVSGIKPFAVMTTNPGDIGHSWYSQLYDVTRSYGDHRQVKVVQNPNGKSSKVFFIPAFLDDNKIGIDRDPDYERRLMERDPDVARALRWGDWSVFAGQAFPDWRYDKHVEPYRELPSWYLRWRGVDYGYTHPFICLWKAKDPDTGRIYIYREYSQTRLTDRQQARNVIENTPKDEKIIRTFVSPDMWNTKNLDNMVSTSVEEYRKEGLIVTRADNDRINGKRKIHRMLANLPDGKPGLIVFDTCPELIRCMPSLTRSKTNPEDVEKVDGDDPFDCLRYVLTDETGSEEKLYEPLVSVSPLQEIGKYL
jgi:hypothetical protein